MRIKRFLLTSLIRDERSSGFKLRHVVYAQLPTKRPERILVSAVYMAANAQGYGSAFNLVPWHRKQSGLLSEMSFLRTLGNGIVCV